jgi:hypothetical protein
MLDGSRRRISFCPTARLRLSWGVRSAGVIGVAMLSVAAGCGQNMPDRVVRMTRGRFSPPVG